MTHAFCLFITSHIYITYRIQRNKHNSQNTTENKKIVLNWIQDMKMLMIYVTTQIEVYIYKNIFKININDCSFAYRSLQMII